MEIVKLIDIDLLSSSVSESAYNEYVKATVYATGNTIMLSFEEDESTARTPHEIYISLADANQGNYPPDSSAKWSLVGTTNRWEMFDEFVSTQTDDTDDIIVEIDAQSTNAVGLFNLHGGKITLMQIIDTELFDDSDCANDSFEKETAWSYDAGDEEYDCSGTQAGFTKLYQDINVVAGTRYVVKFTVKNYSAGEIAGYAGGKAGDLVNANGDYTQVIIAESTDESGVVADVNFIGSVDDVSIKRIPSGGYKQDTLAGSFTPDYWDYFFAPFTYVSTYYWSYPIYYNSKLRIIITPQAGSAKCGMCKMGRSHRIGATKYKPRIGILDYSKKDTDDLGRTYLSQGVFAKENGVDVYLENAIIDAVYQVLEDTRGTAIIFNANGTDTEFGSLVTYGFYQDFEIVLEGPKMSMIAIDIKGLI